MNRNVTALALTGAFAALFTIAPAIDSQAADASNPTVQARMDLMKTIGAQTKILGNMAKGTTAFDAAAAQAAATTMAEAAAEIPAKFEPQEDDPASEAKPIIWDQWDDFTAKAMDLETAASAAAGSITDQASIGPAMGQIGAACKACHSVYRE